MEAEGRLSRDVGVLRSSRDGVSAPRAREGSWTRENYGKVPQPWPAWLQWPPQAPSKGPCAALQGPGSPQVNAFCTHQGTEAAVVLSGRGGGIRPLGDRGRRGHSPVSRRLAQTGQSGSRLGPSCSFGAGWGSFSPSQALRRSVGARARVPLGEPIPGRASPPPWPDPPSAEPWPAPCPAPRSPGLP